MDGRTILWVDDDQDLVAALVPQLEKQGWRVCHACSAEEGRERAADIKPDLVVMDVIMGGEHGLSATESLKADTRMADIPVIIFSGLSSRWGQTTATREDVLNTEAVEFLDKSAPAGELVSAIRRQLTRVPASEVAPLA